MDELYAAPEMFLSESGSYHPLCPVEDQFVAGEVVNRWHHREQSRRLKDMHESEMLNLDAELAELLFRRKQMLCRLGRNGQWSLWLRQEKIARSTADRLVAQYAESHGLSDELHHREITEPWPSTVSLAAARTFKRLRKILSTPRSRIDFLRILGDLFELTVDPEGWEDSVRLSIPQPVDENDPNLYKVPNVLEITDDGKVKPVDYELKESENEESSVFYPNRPRRTGACLGQ
jgi:hypothetical protein